MAWGHLKRPPVSARAETGLGQDPDPLILTLVLDVDAQATFDELRTAHFPPARNHLAAHVTLFHALPGRLATEVGADVARAAAGRSRFPAQVAGLSSLGRGVAFTLVAPEALTLRADLAGRWSSHLTRQDQAWSRPHVTIQNKVAPATAAALLDALREGFEPWTATAEGLALWRYRGGPWDHMSTVQFR